MAEGETWRRFFFFLKKGTVDRQRQMPPFGISTKLQRGASLKPSQSFRQMKRGPARPCAHMGLFSSPIVRPALQRQQEIKQLAGGKKVLFCPLAVVNMATQSSLLCCSPSRHRQRDAVTIGSRTFLDIRSAFLIRNLDAS